VDSEGTHDVLIGDISRDLLNLAGETSFVSVNGEPAKSGRSVFSPSTITTPDAMSATVNLGKSGKVEFGPNTTFTLSSNGNAISGDLTSGSITVLSAAQAVSVRMLSGEIVELNAGETATATSGKAARDHRDSNGKCIDDDKDGDEECTNGAGWWVWALILGGAVAGVVVAATANNNSDLGGGTTVTSPIR
jgi:hypothetical protein